MRERTGASDLDHDPDPRDIPVPPLKPGRCPACGGAIERDAFQCPSCDRVVTGEDRAWLREDVAEGERRLAPIVLALSAFVLGTVAVVLALA